MNIIVHVNILKRTIESRIYGYEVLGHADYDDYGYDIVCASISTLIFTAINSLEGVAKYKENELSIKMAENGYMFFSLPINDEDTRLNIANIILKITFIGLSSLEKEYGRYINIKTVISNI
ncbi:ribosomal-processing cysteine protease Prp [Staphylococcus equorum]|uniref:Ribosomal processing cysteine protease Prp n=1 Tax=Staphylococcus equorum TaxID=246432 RepID=A0A9X4R0Y9_9STAP|nr:ribosomal-processing cysteine protease Prp [Staphylococcus equorum]MDG0820242.1 ribosomal-processing cysteine protease Prp [Staphylococcus equorum]MDG0841066.1 ribosomal-processing cysteine protease Prp [Staphylococcus equorum]MDG0846567.1 ribosomal-processing cysteine protease Prp [Staphylococcus equorum]